MEFLNISESIYSTQFEITLLSGLPTQFQEIKVNYQNSTDKNTMV